MLILSIPFNTGLQLDQSLSRLDLEPVLPPVTGHAGKFWSTTEVGFTGCNYL